jgi:hypothetical protein
MRDTISLGIGSLLSRMESHARGLLTFGADAPYHLSPASTKGAGQILVKSAFFILRIGV